MSRADTDQLNAVQERAERAAAEVVKANAEAETIRARLWETRHKREDTWDRSFISELTARNLRQELLGIEEDARRRMRQAIADGDFNAALKAFTDERAARWRQMRLADEGRAAAERTGEPGDRFQSVAWRDPRFLETVFDTVEEVAQQRAEDEIDELHAQRDAYVRGERVPLPGSDHDAPT